MDENDAQRFWAKVAIVDDEDSCWTWTAFHNPDGYGRFGYNGKAVAAHRFAYAMHHGLDELPDLCVLHRCDNPPCVRPSHLFLGTQADNMRDRHAKGRFHVRAPRLRLRQASDLLPEEVVQILSLRARGASYTNVSRLFGVSLFTIAQLEKRAA